MHTTTYLALKSLDADQLYVIVSVYWAGLTETAIAGELTELRSRPIGRDRVHRIHLTALTKMKRVLAPLLEDAA